jgi:hypothetical protein
VVVAEWTGAGTPPWPLNFAPDGGTTSGSDMAALGWPIESMAGKTGSGKILQAHRGSPQVVPGLEILTPFYVWRVDRSSSGGTASPWTISGAHESDWGAVTTSYQAALGPSAPVSLNWTGVSSVNFRVTDIPALKAQDAAVTATLGNSGEAYKSGNPISDVDDSVIITAAPLADGEGHDASSTPALVFWKWVCTETGEEFTTGQITVSAPPAGTTVTYTAFWRPKSVLFEVLAGDNGVEVAHYSTSGLYYSKDATGEPAMPLFYGQVVDGQETDRGFKHWTRTVYSIDERTGESVPGSAVVVAGTTDPSYPEYEAVQTTRETEALAHRVVYRAYSRYLHDRVAASVSNTYLLKGAGYVKSPATAKVFGADGYAGAYGLSYNQPADVNYTVMCRRAGDLEAGTFLGADAGAFTDGETGKLWSAAYILFAVDAEGEPVGPEEDPTVPEDPDEPDVPGVPGGGGGGAGTPIGTGISLQLVVDEVGVTAAEAALSIGGAALLEVAFPDNPVAVKSATQGTVYILTVSGIAPATAIVKSVTVNGTAVPESGGKWPVVAGSGSTSVVVTVGFPPLKRLLVNAVSVPTSPDPDNSVTISPDPTMAPDRWAVGSVITLTPVPVAEYEHVLWQRDDAAGLHDEEPGGSDYGFALDADTVVTAGFRKPSLDVVLTVKGSDTLTSHFDWTYEAADADDTVPAEMTHSLFVGSQIGLFKVGANKIQTTGDAAYNSYIDMPIAGVDVSYDGGVTWVDGGGTADYPGTYNAQTSPRAAARIGKHTVTSVPLNDTLHVRIRLHATVSVSIGMPPVRWGGPAWQAAGSMIGTGQNNWGCGFGAATISHESGDVTMQYRLNTLANPTATVPLATLTAQEASPYPNYFDEYPYINVELGDTVTATCTPDTGFYFAAWIDGYFSHTWENSGVGITSEDRLVWPVGNYISSEQTAVITVNEGMKKIMLKMKATVTPRWVIFTQDSEPVLAMRPGATVPEEIVPYVIWSYYQNATNLDEMYFMPLSPVQSARWQGDVAGGSFAALLTAWDVTEGEMTALGITATDSVLWEVNKNNLVTTAERIAFYADLSWGPYESERFDTNPDYLGVYRRVHLTNAAGVHEVGGWEFVGRGTTLLWDNDDPTSYRATYLTALGQKFVVDIEYRVRWVPYVEPTDPDVPYQITVGYHELEDMEQGSVSMEIAGVSTGEINSRILTPTVQPGDTVILRAVPRAAGFTFVSWLNASEEVVSTDATYTVNPDTDGYVFLATFTAEIVDPPVNTTVFHVGFVAGNAGRGSIAVRIWRADTTVEDYTVTAEGGADYQLHPGDNAYVVAIAGSGWEFGGWVDSYGLPRGSVAGYYPLADAGASGVALHRDVFFSASIVPPVTGNVPFRAGFLNPADVPRAIGLVSVNGTLVVTLNGRQYADMMLTEGDSVSMEVIAAAGYVLSGFVDLAYAAASVPKTVLNVSVTNQGLLAVLGLAAPPVDPPPEVVPGTPVTGAGLWLFDGGTENKAFVWRSRRFETAIPTEFNSVKVCRNGSFFPAAVALRLNAYSSPEMTSANSDINLPITDEVPRRLPKIRRERYFEIEVTAKDDIECVKIASSMGELQNG